MGQVNWTNESRRELREALLSVYSDPRALNIFLYDNFDLRLNLISSDPNLEYCAQDVIEYFESRGHLDDLYQKFINKNSTNERIKNLINEIEGKGIISHIPKIADAEWKIIFSAFTTSDISVLRTVCDAAFLEHHQKSVFIAAPDAPLDSIDAIRNLLSRYDDRKLTRTFVQRAIATLRATSPDRDFSRVLEWYGGEIPADRPATKLPSHGYLLISVELIAGRLRLIPELYFPGISLLERKLSALDFLENKDIDLTRSPTEAANEIAEEIAKQLCAWVEEATEKVAKDQEEPISIELFLPYELLGERIDRWPVWDDLSSPQTSSPQTLGEYCSTIARSFDRASSLKRRQDLKPGWSKLQNWLNCSPSDRAIGEWNCTQCLDELKRRELKKQLNNHPVVHFSQGLPESPNDRLEVLITLVRSSAPIALWNHQPNETIADEIHRLLTPDNLQEFAKLAAALKDERINGTLLADLGMLCDCPDRWPDLHFFYNPLRTPA